MGAAFMLHVFGSLAVLVLAQASQGPEVVVDGQRPDSQKRVCKTSVATGSIMPSRTCRTKAEWEAIQQRSIAAMEQVRDHHELQRHIQANRKDDQ